MSTPKHTLGKLIACHEWNRGHFATDSEGRKVFWVSDETGPLGHGDRAKNWVNRIVACVNACEGIEDPADLRKQRDELLEALKRAYYDAIRFLNDGDFKTNIEWDAGYIVDAIAKAEGQL
jgi:hypothetical protein